MTDLHQNPLSRSIFHELDKKVKSTAWNSSVSEAHGLLSGLACRGVDKDSLSKMQSLFQISEQTEWVIFESLFEIILSDLESDELLFNLSLPENDGNINDNIEYLGNWCNGFIQGFYYDGKEQHKTSKEVQELLSDIMEIASIDVKSSLQNSEQDSYSLVEIEEYLRVGIQLIYEDLGISNPVKNESETPN